MKKLLSSIIMTLLFTSCGPNVDEFAYQGCRLGYWSAIYDIQQELKTTPVDLSEVEGLIQKACRRD